MEVLLLVFAKCQGQEGVALLSLDTLLRLPAQACGMDFLGILMAATSH